MEKKVLILYTSVGLGHKSIAENIGFILSGAGYEVKLYNILEIDNNWLVKITQKFHRIVNLHLNFIWHWLYTSPWFSRVSLPYRIRVAGRNYNKTLQIIRAEKPDCIITTQTTASAVVAFLKKARLFTGTFGIAFSDFHLHPYWLYEQADFYLCNNYEQKQQMAALGIAERKIFICGITLKPKVGVDVAATRQKFNIAPAQKIVLVGSGSLGYGIGANLLAELSLALPNAKIIVVCGKNFKLREHLKQKFTNPNFIILGLFSPMSELYAISDVFLTKPGGLSVAESLQWRLPMVISHRLPGQEELNYTFLLKAGLILPESGNIIRAVAEEILSGNFRKSLATNPNLGKLVGSGSNVLAAAREFIG